VLDARFADAVQAGDLTVAKAAFEKGAAVDLHYVGGMALEIQYLCHIFGLDSEDDLPQLFLHDEYGIHLLDRMHTFVTSDTIDELQKIGEGFDGIVIQPIDEKDAVPLICLVADNLLMINWLLDRGANVNARQPDNIAAYDQPMYGGAKPPMCRGAAVRTWR
jgi:hypothetical protein